MITAFEDAAGLGPLSTSSRNWLALRPSLNLQSGSTAWREAEWRINIRIKIESRVKIKAILLRDPFH